MTSRGRAWLLAAAVAVLGSLALPALAGAHAALLATKPSASVTVTRAPRQVSLRYSEAVEPRFAIVSVTDAQGHQQAAGPPRRSPANPDVLVVPLRPNLARGWYLVYWRVISADGHPVRGAFTFARGPSAGPAPQFVIPSLRETAATPGLLIARWAVFLSLMTAVGLAFFRLVLTRALMRSVPGAQQRILDRGVLIAVVVGLVAIPIYLEASTAEFSLRSFFDFGNVVPLFGDSNFGRGWLRGEIILALFGVAALIAVRLDKPDRRQRSVVELLSQIGVALAAAALLIIPGLAGHAAQEHPAGLSVALDWVHLLGGSIWLGGLVGLTAMGLALGTDRRVAGLRILVPAFSRIALVTVIVIATTGTIVAIQRLPTFGSLFSTSYGQSLVVKVAIFLVALPLAAVNLLRTRPRLAAAGLRPGLGAPAASLLRRLVGGEMAILFAVLFVAGVLSSLPPPSSALSKIGKADASVGPGAVNRTITHGAYRVTVQLSPNRAAVPNQFAVRVTRDGRPVTGAGVTAQFNMLDMEMQPIGYRLNPQPGGRYGRSAPALVMVGHWGVNFHVTPPKDNPFDVLLLDRAAG